MNPLQMEPPDPPPQKRPGGIVSPSAWLKQRVLAAPDSAITSLGEFLLPTLLGAMDACWIAAALIGLAGASIFGAKVPLLPFWAPFVFIVGTQWFFYTRDRRSEKTKDEQAGESGKVTVPDAPLFLTLVALLCLLIIWLQVYAPYAAIIDPRWLGTMFSDILFLNNHFYQVVFIVALAFILCWRGLRLSSRIIEPSTVFRALCLGIVVLIVITALRAEMASTGTQLHDDALLFLLIPLFLYVSLAAHSLARIAFVRRSHATGLQGSIVIQERAVMTVMGLLGAILLVITIIIALFASPTFFTSTLQALAPVGAAIINVYNWLIALLAGIAVIIATPFFWLLTWLTSFFPARAPNHPNPPIKIGNLKAKAPFVPQAASPLLLLVLKILVPVVVLLVVILLVRRALHRRGKMRARRQQRDEDSHESLWSWSLFWSQLNAILRAFFGRFLPEPIAKSDARITSGVESADPAARDIRAIYRAFLKKAEVRGFARKKDETPDELRLRLDEKAPLVEPQLEAITGAYMLVRYGESLPDAADVTYMQGKWRELDQKWV